MTNYRRIADQFNRIGYNEGSKFNQYEINQVLDKIVQKNMNINEFNRDVSQQLFEQTDKDVNGQVILKDYINTIIIAHTVLDKHIRQYEQKFIASNQPQEKLELKESIQQFQEDYQLLTLPFHINAAISKVAGVERRPESSRVHASSIFQQSSSAEQSTSLKFVLIVAILGFLFELILMFAKHHFLNFLAYLLVLSIFFLNYFDKQTIKLALLALLSSLVLDFIWLFALSGPFWNNSPVTHHSTLQAGFLKFIYIMTIILMFAKAFIGIILFNFRQLPQRSRKVVSFGKIVFELNGHIANNPFRQIFTGRVENSQNRAFI